MLSFNANCAAGIRANAGRMREYLEHSLMLVTALNPLIGYESAARIAQKAHHENLTLRQAAVELGLLSGGQFDRAVRPEAMV